MSLDSPHTLEHGGRGDFGIFHYGGRNLALLHENSLLEVVDNIHMSSHPILRHSESSSGKTLGIEVTHDNLLLEAEDYLHMSSHPMLRRSEPSFGQTLGIEVTEDNLLRDTDIHILGDIQFWDIWDIHKRK